MHISNENFDQLTRDMLGLQQTTDGFSRFQNNNQTLFKVLHNKELYQLAQKQEMPTQDYVNTNQYGL